VVGIENAKKIPKETPTNMRIFLEIYFIIISFSSEVITSAFLNYSINSTLAIFSKTGIKRNYTKHTGRLLH